MIFNLVPLPFLFALTSAHSGIWNIDIDGINYPARDARFDGKLGAKRIEWSFENHRNIPWAAVQNGSSPDVTCNIFTFHTDLKHPSNSRAGGKDPKPPALKAIARAGANVTVQWSGIVRTHYGPIITVSRYSLLD